MTSFLLGISLTINIIFIIVLMIYFKFKSTNKNIINSLISDKENQNLKDFDLNFWR